MPCIHCFIVRHCSQGGGQPWGALPRGLYPEGDLHPGSLPGGWCLPGRFAPGGGSAWGVCQGGLHLRIGMHPGWSASRGLYPEGSESWRICIQEGLEQTPQSDTKGYGKLADSMQYALNP